MITNTTSTPITITLPKNSLLYTNDDTLPDLTQIENETKEELAEVKHVDISDGEQTFMDDNVTVQDVQLLHEEPAQVFKFHH